MLDLKKYKEIRATTIWKTKDGDEYPVKRMETSHVQNTIILLTTKQKACEELQIGDLVIKGVCANDWIELLKTELEYRKDPKSVVKKEEIIPIEEPTEVLVEEEEIL